MQEPKFRKRASKPGLFVLLFGDTNSGKTYTASTFPGPIYYIDTEDRAEDTIERYFPDKDVHIFEDVTDFNFGEGTTNVRDPHKTIENITRNIVWYASKVKKGEIKEGTFVLESASDVWRDVITWAVYEVSKYRDKQGNKRADPLTESFNQQFDWKIPNKRYLDIIGSLRHLLKYGVNVVVTAREDQIPKHVADMKQEVTLKDKLRAQKDTPFYADCIFNMKKIEKNGVIKYMAKVEKLGIEPTSTRYVDSLTYEKIRGLLNGAKTTPPTQQVPQRTSPSS